MITLSYTFFPAEDDGAGDTDPAAQAALTAPPTPGG